MNPLKVVPTIEDVNLEFCSMMKDNNSHMVLRVVNNTEFDIQLSVLSIGSNFSNPPEAIRGERYRKFKGGMNKLPDQVFEDNFYIVPSNLPVYEIPAGRKGITTSNEMPFGMFIVKNPTEFGIIRSIEELLYITLSYSVKFLKEGEILVETAAIQTFNPFVIKETKGINNGV